MKRLSPTVTLVVGLILGGLVTYAGLHVGGRLAPRPERPDLLLTLGQTVDAEQRRIDLLIAEGRDAEAIAALEALRGGPWPEGGAGGATAVILRHDVYGQLLRLRLDHPKVDARTPDELLAIADAGLGPEAATIEANAFTARLIAIRGEILESLGRDDEALSAYEKALDINRALLQRALGEGGM